MDTTRNGSKVQHSEVTETVLMAYDCFRGQEHYAPVVRWYYPPTRQDIAQALKLCLELGLTRPVVVQNVLEVPF